MSAADQNNDDDSGFLKGLEAETARICDEEAEAQPLSPVDLLVDLSWQAIRNFPGACPLSAGSTLAAIIRVPTSAWVDAVHHFVHENERTAMIVDGKVNKRDWSTQEALIVDALERGTTIFGIAADPDTQLPPLLRTAADIVVTVPAPTPELMRRAIRLHTGRSRVPALTAIDIGGLDLLDLASALRPDTTPTACVNRLKAASARRSVDTSDDRTPLLHELTGYGEAMDWCLDMVEEVKAFRAGRPAEFSSAMLFSKPGLGKTQLAKSLAKTTKLPLISTSVASWFQHREGHLGDVLQQVNEVFQRARAAAPCVLWIDECDALPDRAKLEARGRDWWSSVITNVLVQIDACRADPRGVILLGATNHLENLDAALLRPGRFDRKIEILPPDADGIVGILRTHLGQDCPDADLPALGRLMPGTTGARIATIVRDARRKARRANRPMTEADLRAEILPPDPRSRDDLRHVAIHEAGHAVVAHLLGYGVESVTIRGEGDAGGWTDIRMPSVSDRALVEARVKVLLAGRAANVFFGAPPDTGATSDLAEATRLLAAARLSFGLAGSLVYRAAPGQALDMVTRDKALADAIGQELGRLMTSTQRLVADHSAAIQRVAYALLERSVLDGHALAELIASEPVPRVQREPRLDRSLPRL